MRIIKNPIFLLTLTLNQAIFAIESESAVLTNLTPADGSAFAADAAQGWIWDIFTPSPYIYFNSATSPTTPQGAQLNNLTNIFCRIIHFSES